MENSSHVQGPFRHIMKQGFWITFFRALLVIELHLPLPVFATWHRLSTYPRGKNKGALSKDEAQYLRLGHPKDYDKFHFYVALLRKILLKYKLDLSHHYTIFC